MRTLLTVAAAVAVAVIAASAYLYTAVCGGYHNPIC